MVGYPDLDPLLQKSAHQNPSWLINEGLRQLAQPLTNEQIEQLFGLVKLLNQWNQAYNLTAIRDPYAMVVYHVLESLAVRSQLAGAVVLDVGTGAGFPGLPLAIVEPDRQFILVDSNVKKIRFVRQVLLELNIQNVTPMHQRVEALEMVHPASTMVGRAIAAETILGGVPKLLDPNGRVVLMLGPEPDHETIRGYIGQLAPCTVREYRLTSMMVPWLHAPRHLLTLDMGSPK